MYETASIFWDKHLRHTTMEKYNNIGKVWYFRFDDDDKMSYKYIKLSYENILSITETWMDILTYTTSHIAQKIKKVTEKTNYILDIFST